MKKERMYYFDDKTQTNKATSVKILRPFLVRDNGIDGYIKVTRVIIPTGIKSHDQEIEQGIKDIFFNNYCPHAHDCCGCASSFAYAKKVKNRTWKVEIFTSRNI